MWKESPEVIKKRRKGKWVLCLICGPFFTLALAGSILLSGVIGVWFAILAPISATAFIGDRLGKYFSLTAQQYAAPVAFSCTICPILVLIILSQLANSTAA